MSRHMLNVRKNLQFQNLNLKQKHLFDNRKGQIKMEVDVQGIIR